MSFLGADVGGGGCKVAAFTSEGNVLAEAFEPYGQLRPRPGWLEFDLEAQWLALRRALTSVANAESVRGDPPCSLALSVAGDAVVAVDSAGRQLYPSIASPDERGREEGERIAALAGGAERLYELTGTPVDNMYALNRILWFRAHMPDVARRTWKWLCWAEFFYVKLGLPPAIDESLAARTLAFDLSTRHWSRELLNKVAVEESALGEVVPAGTRIGTVDPKVADELGLPRDLVGVSGGFDQACATLGAGAHCPGIASVGTGSVECYSVPIAEQIRGEAGRALLDAVVAQVPHAGPRCLLALGYHFAAGSLHRWYRDALVQPEVGAATHAGLSPFDRIDTALRGEPTSLLALPHFSGAFSPRRDPASRGALIGLTLRTSRAEIGRALLEGTAYELRLIVEHLERHGVRANCIRAVGGGSRSRTWLQIKADVLNRPIERTAVAEAGCLAGAMLGAVATGAHRDVAQAAESMVRVTERFEPDARRAAAYARRFDLYRELHPLLGSVHRRLSRVDGEE